MLLIFSALVPLLAPRSSPVTRAAYERIEQGMTNAKVEKILGGPPGDYSTRPQNEIVLIGYRSPRTQEWKGDEVTISVFFACSDTSGTYVVSCKHVHETEPVEVGMVNTLLWRFDRWRKRVFGIGP
jgi:hypothetical protein